MFITHQNDTDVRGASLIAVTHVATSAEGTANSAAITVSDLESIDDVFGVQILDAGGNPNVTGLDVTWSTNVVTVAATGITAGDVIRFFAIERQG